MTTGTVLSGPERRRRWSASEKARIVAESLAPGAVITEVARRHDVHPNLLHAWRRQAGTGVVPKESGDSRFLPVRIAASGGIAGASASSTMIEVMLGNGVMLRVPEGVSAGRAAQLAAALAGFER